MSKKKYIFGYGSLISGEDVFRTLGRRIDLIYPAELKGWIRDWSVVVDATTSHRRFAAADGGEAPAYIAALNVRRPREGEVPTNPNGVLFEVTDADLQKLDQRESHYQRLDVTDDVVNKPTGVVYTYSGLDQFLDIHNTEITVVIPGPYLELVTRGFASLAPGMHEKYLSSTHVSDLLIQDLVIQPTSRH